MKYMSLVFDLFIILDTFRTVLIGGIQKAPQTETERDSSIVEKVVQDKVASE